MSDSDSDSSAHDPMKPGYHDDDPRACVSCAICGKSKPKRYHVETLEIKHAEEDVKTCYDSCENNGGCSMCDPETWGPDDPHVATIRIVVCSTCSNNREICLRNDENYEIDFQGKTFFD